MVFSLFWYTVLIAIISTQGDSLGTPPGPETSNILNLCGNGEESIIFIYDYLCFLIKKKNLKIFEKNIFEIITKKFIVFF